MNIACAVYAAVGVMNLAEPHIFRLIIQANFAAMLRRRVRDM
jgi:hypothetical protein